MWMLMHPSLHMFCFFLPSAWTWLACDATGSSVQLSCAVSPPAPLAQVDAEKLARSIYLRLQKRLLDSINIGERALAVVDDGAGRSNSQLVWSIFHLLKSRFDLPHVLLPLQEYPSAKQKT
eukprot:6487127-Amphidinium_carterae.2